MGPGPYSLKFSWQGKYKIKMMVSIQPARPAKGFLQPKSQLSNYRLLAALGSAVHCSCGGCRCRGGADRTERRPCGPRLCCTANVDSIRKCLSGCDGARFWRSFLTLLLRFNFRTVKGTQFKCTGWSVLEYLYSCGSVPMIQL